MNPLTELTLSPALLLLLGDAGYEAVDFPFETAWKVFRAYLRWPAATPDEASFQVDLAEAADGPVSVRLVRQLTVDDGYGEPYPMAVCMEFLYEQRVFGRTSAEVWRSECASDDEFATAVETSPEFANAVEATFISSTVFLTSEVRKPGAA